MRTIIKIFKFTLLCIFYLSIWDNKIYGQPITFEFSPISKLEIQGKEFSGIIDYYKEKYVLIGYNCKSSPKLCYYSKKLELNKVYSLNFSNQYNLKCSPIASKSYIINDKLIVLTECHNPAIKKYQIHAWHLNEKGAILKGPIEIIRSNTSIKSESPDYLLDISHDKNYIVVIDKTKMTFGQELAGVQYKFFDSELELSLHRIINIPVDNLSLTLDKAITYNKKTAVLAFKSSKIPKTTNANIAVKSVSLDLVRINLEEASFHYLPINTSDNPFVNQVKLVVSRDQKSLFVVSSCGSGPTSGVVSLHIQKFNNNDSVPLTSHIALITPNFRKIAETNNRKFIDTNKPKRVLKGVMDLDLQFFEINKNQFMATASIKRNNIDAISDANKLGAVNYDKSITTYYCQGATVVNGTWSQGPHSVFDHYIDQAIQNKGSMPIAYGTAFLPHPKFSLCLLSELPENSKLDEKHDLKTQITGKNWRKSRSHLLHLDTIGRKNHWQIFANPNDLGYIAPNSIFYESPNRFLFLGEDVKGRLRLIRGTY